MSGRLTREVLTYIYMFGECHDGARFKQLLVTVQLIESLFYLQLQLTGKPFWLKFQAKIPCAPHLLQKQGYCRSASLFPLLPSQLWCEASRTIPIVNQLPSDQMINHFWDHSQFPFHFSGLQTTLAGNHNTSELVFAVTGCHFALQKSNSGGYRQEKLNFQSKLCTIIDLCFYGCKAYTFVHIYTKRKTKKYI